MLIVLLKTIFPSTSGTAPSKYGLSSSFISTTFELSSFVIEVFSFFVLVFVVFSVGTLEFGGSHSLCAIKLHKGKKAKIRVNIFFISSFNSISNAKLVKESIIILLCFIFNFLSVQVVLGALISHLDTEQLVKNRDL